MAEKKAPREYIPTPEEKAFLIDLENQMLGLQQQREGALRLMLKQQKLQGNFTWQNDRLVEQPVVELVK